jgi:hypothetical protein
MLRFQSKGQIAGRKTLKEQAWNDSDQQEPLTRT